MNIHEYQAKQILKRYGLPIPNEKVFDQKTLSLDEIRSLGKAPLAVKAQIHAGGRGKAGGVKIVDTPEAAYGAAQKMLGTTLATYQTAGVAKPIDCVLIHFAKKIEKELYLAVALDRERELPCVIFSDAGGMEIEEVAQKSPEKILKCHFDPDGKRDIAFFELFLSKNASRLGPLSSRKSELADFMAKMAQIFVDLDISILEINPLAILQDQTFKVIDAKINFDDNGLFRHPEIAALHDPRQEDSREVEAKQFDLSYVGLEGNIGCMVNGAGLAMATMDIIKHEGGEPANLLDVGGGAAKERVTAAFKIILKDPRVKAILVNIFGGIMRCDIIAEGILAAVQEMDLKVPLVVRLEGTNVKEGKEILAKSKLKIISADSFSDGAKKVVAAIR